MCYGYIIIGSNPIPACFYNKLSKKKILVNNCINKVRNLLYKPFISFLFLYKNFLVY